MNKTIPRRPYQIYFDRDSVPGSLAISEVYAQILSLKVHWAFKSTELQMHVPKDFMWGAGVSIP